MLQWVKFLNGLNGCTVSYDSNGSDSCNGPRGKNVCNGPYGYNDFNDHNVVTIKFVMTIKAVITV